MVKYNCKILERKNKDELIVGVSKVGKHKLTLEDVVEMMNKGFMQINARLLILEQNDQKIFGILERNNLH